MIITVIAMIAFTGFSTERRAQMTFMYIGMYVVGIMCIEFLKTIFYFHTDFYPQQWSCVEKYEFLVNRYAKIGIVKNLPSIIGLTLGLFARLIGLGFVKVTKFIYRRFINLFADFPVSSVID